ncbi:virulence factor Mce family protein [Mycolicibacter senuensis]|uniref:Mce family protein Mce3D n=1 Tax=Mycolicibacter senuensis TaxID=386913 RepID=A0A7I9XKN9_9MYCO|nr:virulence factor Mce family protein [Mycolicibacter senuensis]ORW68688.1 mammalian cell entry protein [Mycolicibacter senuensis]GFG69947.1 Mce family protein Mce3D [Mycolicibacter senuensis]
MMTSRKLRMGLAAVLVAVLAAGVYTVGALGSRLGRTHVTAYFENSNGIFVGDEVRILGVRVGRIDSIEAQPERVKVRFWFDDKYRVPADAKAAVLSPSLVTARAIQLTPVYAGGPVLADNAVIPRERTAVPVEWDDFRDQLQNLTEMLQPTEAGGVSTLGQVVQTAADNLRGEGANIRTAIIELSQAISALGDHSGDIFSTVKNLSILVTALRDSDTVLRKLNQNLASATAALANNPNEVANAVSDLNSAVTQVRTFVADNRETLGTTSAKLASVSQTLVDSLDDLKQTLHVLPTAAQNFVNIYQPAQGTLTGALSTNNLSDPLSFVCGAIQAASRQNAEQSAKLCVQYLAPIVKNRQYNFFPLGENLFVGASARPNEVTYSEDWLRPDHVPEQADPAPQGEASPQDAAMLPPELTEVTIAQPTDPQAGLAGLMMPSGAGS